MELVQIYFTKLNKLEVISNFLASFLFLFEKFSLLDLDPDPGGQMNADPDPQPCLIHNVMCVRLVKIICRCVAWIEQLGLKRVGLQFPDSLLHAAPTVCKLIQVSSIQTFPFILAWSLSQQIPECLANFPLNFERTRLV